MRSLKTWVIVLILMTPSYSYPTISLDCAKRAAALVHVKYYLLRNGVHLSIDPGQLPPGITEDQVLTALLQYHDRLVGPQNLKPATAAQVNEITHALFGPAEGRPEGVMLTEDNVNTTRKAVQDFVHHGLPIEGVTFWGGARQYGVGDDQGIDAGDLLALLRYEAMNQSVKNAGHAPGIKVQLVFEDLGRRFMGGDTPEMHQRVRTYQTGMDNLVHIVTDAVEFHPESEIIARRNVPRDVLRILGMDQNLSVKGSDELFFKLAERAEEVMYRYIRASENGEFKAPLDAADKAGFERVQGLPEYLALEQLGFKGGIPIAQREYVRNRTRLRLGYPAGLTEEELDRHVAKYFAQGFARAKFDLRIGTSIPAGQSDALQTLSYSFLPYPPGTPPSMIVRRVELEAVGTKNGKVVPCWGGCTLMSWNNGQPQITIEPAIDGSTPFAKIPIQLTDSKGRSVNFDLRIAKSK